MKHRFIYASSYCIVYKAYGCSWNSDSFRRTYESIVRSLMTAGLGPTHLAAVAPGISRDYGSFSTKHSRLLQRFDQTERVELTRGYPGGTHPETSGTAYCHFDVPRRYGGLAWIPESVAEAGTTLHASWRDILKISKSIYSYQYHAQWHPQDCPWAVNFIHAEWDDTRRDRLTLWLHDIFPHNNLGKEYLDAPVGYTGQSLRQWIEADTKNRGTLTPYTDALLDWAPPPAHIPAIREYLYRMGRVFSGHFLLKTTSWAKAMVDRSNPNPLFRPDPYAPWEAPADYPIPARFRADTYAGTDPAITVWRRFESGFDSL